MAEYIKRETAIKRVMETKWESGSDGAAAMEIVAATPAADVAPVVRCKDCKHRYSDSWCEYADDDDNFYCARGERKEGADNEP